MLSILRKHWLLFIALLFFLLAALVILCWYVYAAYKVVIYPIVSLYDYTDTGQDIGANFNTILAFLFFFWPGLCFLLFWLRGKIFALNFRGKLRIGAITFLVISILWVGLLAHHSILGKNGRDSGTERKNRHTFYWHRL